MRHYWLLLQIDASKFEIWVQRKGKSPRNTMPSNHQNTRLRGCGWQIKNCGWVVRISVGVQPQATAAFQQRGQSFLQDLPPCRGIYARRSDSLPSLGRRSGRWMQLDYPKLSRQRLRSGDRKLMQSMVWVTQSLANWRHWKSCFGAGTCSV
jgi:hypothetical protein